MTRALIKITSSNDPYHSQFKDKSRELPLTKKSELAEPIRERMKDNVKNGKMISQNVVCITAKGSNFQRMILVNSSGIINTYLLIIYFINITYYCKLF